MPKHSPIQIHIRVCLCVWFCDHFEWLLWRVTEVAQVTVGGQSAASFGAWFDLVGGWEFSYTCVYVEFL